MGYARYTLSDGREAGYGVQAACDRSGCYTLIDRGLAYACGGYPGAGDDFCDGFFCHAHLFSTQSGTRCEECINRIFAETVEGLLDALMVAVSQEVKGVPYVEASFDMTLEEFLARTETIRDTMPDHG